MLFGAALGPALSAGGGLVLLWRLPVFTPAIVLPSPTALLAAAIAGAICGNAFWVRAVMDGRSDREAEGGGRTMRILAGVLAAAHAAPLMGVIAYLILVLPFSNRPLGLRLGYLAEQAAMLSGAIYLGGLVLIPPALVGGRILRRLGAGALAIHLAVGSGVALASAAVMLFLVAPSVAWWTTTVPWLAVPVAVAGSVSGAIYWAVAVRDPPDDESRVADRS